MNTRKTIHILGVEISKDAFPHLYRIAETNPDGLAGTLKSLARASGGDPTDFTSVAINLESDLAHG